MTPKEKIERVQALLLGFFNGDKKKVRAWMAYTNPVLGDQSPNNMIRKGRVDTLLSYIESALEGNFP